MAKYKVMVCQFPGGNSTHPDVSDWVLETVLKMEKDPSIGPGNVVLWRRADTPVTMTRNLSLLKAEKEGADYVLMVDSDMSPDLPYPGAVPFWDAAWPFVQAHAGPCVIAAPYCGPPPDECVYVFEWQNKESGGANPDMQLAMVPRSKAADLHGIQRAAALPTGLMLIDMRAVARLPHPRFYYEWKGDGEKCSCCGVPKPGPQAVKASTEDVTFSRDLDAAGAPMYCAWDSWAGHHKSKVVGKPFNIPADTVPRALLARAQALPRISADFRAADVPAGGDGLVTLAGKPAKPAKRSAPKSK